MQPSTVNGTDLGGQEWRDALFLGDGIDPPDLPTYCYGCQAKFSISHSLDCKNGGLVTERHNDIRDGVADLSGKAFTPSHVCDDPPHLLRSLREEDEGHNRQGKGKQQPFSSAAGSGHGT